MNKSNKKKLKFNRKTGFVIMFLLPAVLLFAIIYAYPLANIFITSFSKWNYKNLSSPKFLGFGHMFDNYIKLFTTDYYFMSALLNSLKWVLLVLVIQVPLAIIVAFVLSKRPRGWKLVRNTYIIPNIISTSAIGLIFLNLYDPARGAVTQIINSLSSSNDVNILASGGSAFWGVTFSFVLFGGTAMLLVLSQISAISPDLYEAARIDGANSFQIDTKIVLPLLKPIIGTIAILATNYGLLLYNEIALLTGGGPDKATYSLSYYIYQTAMGSSKLNFSLANTAGVVQFILGLVLVGLISKVFKMDKSHI